MLSRLFTIIVLVGGTVPAASQGIADNAARVARELRRDAREVRARVAVREKEPSVELSFGLAHERSDSDGRATATPFSLSYTTQRSEGDAWRFQLAGGGYTRVSTSGEPSASGLSDLGFNVYRPLAPAWTGMAGIGIPVHGEVGSRHWSEHVRLIHSKDFGTAWAYAVVGELAHQPGQPAGVASTSQGLLGQVEYRFAGDHVLALNVSRGHQRGAGGSTVIGLEYNLPLMPARWDMTLIAGRGISSGARHTTFEVGWTTRF